MGFARLVALSPGDEGGEELLVVSGEAQQLRVPLHAHEKIRSAPFDRLDDSELVPSDDAQPVAETVLDWWCSALTRHGSQPTMS